MVLWRRRMNMKRHRIGGFTAARVVEIEPPLATPAQMFPDFDPEIFRAMPAG